MRYLWSRALPSQALDLPISINLVVFEHCQLRLLALVLNLFRGCINFLLSLFCTPAQAQNKVEGGLLLDVVVREGSTILKLFARKNQALLVRRDAFLV